QDVGVLVPLAAQVLAGVNGVRGIGHDRFSSKGAERYRLATRAIVRTPTARNYGGTPTAPGKPTPRPSRRPPEQPTVLTVLNPNAAGIDVHSDMHLVCVLTDRLGRAGGGDSWGLPAHVRRFGANSCDLHAIADWLRECGVSTVALESTGVYWIPLFELLETRGFAAWLV